MIGRFSLDTNILVYAVDPGAGTKNDIAKQILRSSAIGEGVLTQQVIGEFLNVSRRMAHLNQRRLRRIALGLSTTFPLLATSKELLFAAFDRSVRCNLQFWDSVIASVCIANGVSHLISEDMQDGRIIDGMAIVNPFLSTNRPVISELFGGELKTPE
ncbi:MAG: PIN domain-containing protein [Sphingomicrobium sp.]